MKLGDILVEKKDVLLKSWRDRILESYPLDASKFLRGEKDRFHNPVGEAIRQDTESIFNHLIGEMKFSDTHPFPRHLIKIRAVQDFTASAAVKFMVQLKSVITDRFKDEIGRHLEEYIELENRIDDLTLIAFDTYMSCRQVIHDIRVGEIKRRYSGNMIDASASGDEEMEIKE